MSALVIFGRDNAHWAAGILASDCRHVLCAILDEDANMWITHNLDADGLNVSIEADGSFDLKNYYEIHGFDVYAVDYRPEDISYAPFLMNSCVGYTKALLGLRSWAVTPQQLRTYVRRIHIGEVPCVNYALT